MANAKTDVKEGNANKAEAQVTPSVEPAPQDISAAPNTGTPAEQQEGNANKAEAKKSKDKRVKEADAKTTQETAKPFDMNAQNRRISELLRANRQERDVKALAAQNRKLKHEVSRLKQEVSGQPQT